MAAVTVNYPPYRHVLGDLATRVFDISGATGSTLATGMTNISFVAIQQSTSAGSASTITSFSVSGGTITFTSGTMTHEVVMVYGKSG